MLPQRSGARAMTRMTPTRASRTTLLFRVLPSPHSGSPLTLADSKPTGLPDGTYAASFALHLLSAPQSPLGIPATTFFTVDNATGCALDARSTTSRGGGHGSTVITNVALRQPVWCSGPVPGRPAERATDGAAFVSPRTDAIAGAMPAEVWATQGPEGTQLAAPPLPVAGACQEPEAAPLPPCRTDKGRGSRSIWARSIRSRPWTCGRAACLPRRGGILLRFQPSRWSPLRSRCSPPTGPRSRRASSREKAAAAPSTAAGCTRGTASAKERGSAGTPQHPARLQPACSLPAARALSLSEPLQVRARAAPPRRAPRPRRPRGASPDHPLPSAVRTLRRRPASGHAPLSCEVCLAGTGGSARARRVELRAVLPRGCLPCRRSGARRVRVSPGPRGRRL